MHTILKMIQPHATSSVFCSSTLGARLDPSALSRRKMQYVESVASTFNAQVTYLDNGFIIEKHR